ncbi:peptide ABC transporter substrate-binding protein [Propionibacteriaceae bacterium Y2011]
MTTFNVPRRTVLAAVPLTAVAVGATSCGFGSEPGQGPSGGGGGGEGATTLRQANRPVNHLNPAFGGGGSPQSSLLMAMIWEGLVNREEGNLSNYVPGMAESWEISEDALNYTFKIRADAKWSNGDPLTADDFVWSFSYYYSPELADQENENNPSKNGSPDVTTIEGLPDYFAGRTTDFSTVGVKAPDPQTLEITLTAPDYSFMNGLVSLYPLHQESVEANVKDFWMPDNLVGNGPYQMTKYSQNSNATFELNEHYWDAENYTITTREVQFNSSGPTGMMVSYNADEIDLFRVDGDPSALISGRPDLEDQLQAATMIQFKGLCVLPCKNPILQENQKLRQALAMSLDREALASVAPPDAPADSWAPTGIEGFDQLPKIPFDPEGAAKLLAEAGHANGEGVPELQIVTYATMPALEAAVEMWKEHLNINAGVAVREVGVFSEYIQGNMPDDFTGLAFNYRGIAPPMMLALVGKNFNNYNYVPNETAKQYFAYKSGDDKDKYPPAEMAEVVDKLLRDNWLPEYREFDTLAKEAVAAQADPEQALQLAVKAATQFQETYLFIPILWAGYTFMVKPRVHNLTFNSLSDSMFSMKGVTLDPLGG